MDTHPTDPVAPHALVADLTRAKLAADAELALHHQYHALTVLLQSLRTRHELRFVLGMHLERLFPETRGSLFLLDQGGAGRFVPIVRWGLDPEADDAPLPSCVAQHLDHTSSIESLLTTVVPPVRSANQGVCAPLMAEGEMLGVLYAEPEQAGDAPQRPLADEARRRLFDVADRITLPLNVMRMREQLHQQARLDPLTGIANRVFMDDTIERKTAEATNWGADLSVALLDLDHFTMVNHSAGHDAGDHLLTSFVQFLRGQIDTDDVLMRLGGDEFVLVMPAANADEAKVRVDDLHARWLYETPAGSGGHTFSTGIADTRGHGSSARALLRAAHKALAEAKAAGRARVAIAPPFVAIAQEETTFLKKLGITQ